MPISKGTLLIRGFLEARKHMERIVLQAAQLSHFSPVKIFTGTLCLLKKQLFLFWAQDVWKCWDSG